MSRSETESENPSGSIESFPPRKRVKKSATNTTEPVSYDRTTVTLDQLRQKGKNKAFNKLYTSGKAAMHDLQSFWTTLEPQHAERYAEENAEKEVFCIRMWGHASRQHEHLCDMPNAVWAWSGSRTFHYNNSHPELVIEADAGVVWACLHRAQSGQQIIAFIEGAVEPDESQIRMALNDVQQPTQLAHPHAELSSQAVSGQPNQEALGAAMTFPGDEILTTGKFLLLAVSQNFLHTVNFHVCVTGVAEGMHDWIDPDDEFLDQLAEPSHTELDAPISNPAGKYFLRCCLMSCVSCQCSRHWRASVYLAGKEAVAGPSQIVFSNMEQEGKLSASILP